MIRDWIKSGAANLLTKTGMDRRLAPRNVPVVIAYHRVVEDFALASRTSNPSMLVSSQMLERHLDWIGRRYQFVDLDEAGARMEANLESSRQVAAITFDDGYRDFYELAWPILQRKGIPAAVFVVTNYAGTDQVHLHDRLYLLLKRGLVTSRPSALDELRIPGLASMSPYQAMRKLLESLPLDSLQRVVEKLESGDPISEEVCRPLRSLTWDQLERLHKAGITIGSHTRTHVLLPNERKARVIEEIAGSRADIERCMPGLNVRHFAYPSGLFDSVAVKAVASAGYRFAYATTPARSSEHPLLTIPRAVLWENSSVDAHSAFSGSVLDCQIHYAFDALTWMSAYRPSNLIRQEDGR